MKDTRTWHEVFIPIARNENWHEVYSSKFFGRWVAILVLGVKHFCLSPLYLASLAHQERSIYRTVLASPGMLVSPWQYFCSQAWFAPSPIRPSLCVAIPLSAVTLGCLCQFRRNMFSVQEVPALQSLCALTGVVFYGTILSLMWLDAKYVLFPPALPQAIILPRKKHSGVVGICCPICLVDFERDEVLSCGERCGHCFHDSCIQEWIAHIQRKPNQRATCPSCRQELQCQRPPRKGESDPRREQQIVEATTSPSPVPTTASGFSWTL